MSLTLAVNDQSLVNGGVNQTEVISGSEFPTEIMKSAESYSELLVKAENSTDKDSENALELTLIPISTLSSRKSPSRSKPTIESMDTSAGLVTWLALTVNDPEG